METPPKNANRHARLITGSAPKTLASLTGPMIIGILAMISMNLIDTWYVSRLGIRQLAAIGFTFPVVFTIGSIALGLGVGAAAVISRAIGQNDRDGVIRLTSDSLMLSVIIVTVFVIAGMLTVEPVFTLIGAKGDTLADVKSYMYIWYLGMPFVVIPMVGNNGLRATGDTKTPSMIMLTAVTINFVLDPLLIFGPGPFPRWGIAGAAAATVAARAGTLIMSVYVLYFRERMISLKRPALKEAVQSWKRLLYIGIPSAGTSLIMPLSLAIITAMVAKFGNEAVAGFGVASRMEAFALTIVVALGSVLNPFVGQNWGAGRMDRVTQGIKCSHLYSIGHGLVVFVIFLFFADSIASLFNSHPGVVRITASYMIIVSASYGLFGLMNLSGAAFNALNKPIPSTIVAFMRAFVIYIPLALAGSHFFGIKGIFAAAAIANAVGGIWAFFWLRSFRRKLERDAQAKS